jgi:hypothetical protein
MKKIQDEFSYADFNNNNEDDKLLELIWKTLSFFVSFLFIVKGIYEV